MKRASLSKAKTLLFQKLDRIIQDATAEEKDKRLSSVEELHRLLIQAIGNSKNKPAQAILESSTQLSAFSQRKWIWGGIAGAIVLAVALLAFNLNHLSAERIEHQASQSVLNEPPVSESPSSQLQPQRPSGVRPSSPNMSNYQGESWSGYDDCEVRPGQRSW